MKLLICTQAVDRADPTLGFFHRWLEEFAKHCERVEVICLREGEHALPPNVHVYSLGKEKNNNRLTRWLTALRYIVVLCKKYDVVFVHMNPEYLILGGWLWRLLHKKAALWYMHKAVNARLRVATFFANVVCTASKESFRLPTKKLRVLGHGIDTNFFTPDPSVVRDDAWLSLGRLSKSKRHDLAIRAANDAGKKLRIAGEGSEKAALESLAHQLGTHVEFLGGLTQQGVRDEFRRAALFLHTSETGSLDKTILEAVACGCPVKTNNPALKYLESEGPDYVRKNHSLQKLIHAIVGELAV